MVVYYAFMGMFGTKQREARGPTFLVCGKRVSYNRERNGGQSLDVGLVGLPLSGKTTIFNLLTGAKAELNRFGGAKAESRRALAPIPDSRLDRLAEIYHPRKVTPALVNVVDVPGLSHSESGGPNRFLNDVRLVDALIHVVRGFRSELGDDPEPLKDIEDMELELSLSDLDLLEKRRQRISAGKKITKEAKVELELVGHLIEVLESGQRLDQTDLDEDQVRLIRGYQFLTLKPMIWVINLDDQSFTSGDYLGKNAIEKLGREKGIPVVPMAGALEEEIQDLSGEDRTAFMADLGISDSGLTRVAQAMYSRLGLMSFLTAGEDEVRAWTITDGSTAKQAAGKIHSDIERGFIRAEIVAFQDLDRSGTMVKAREQGLIRLEGKDYIMQDGDVVNFRFNV